MGRCWVVGPVTWERVSRVERLPGAGDNVTAFAGSERPGGAALDVACALGGVPVDVSVVGYVGSDELGDRLVRVLTGRNVDVSFLQRLDVPTPQTSIHMAAGGERSVVATVPSVPEFVKVPAAAVQPGDLLYLASGVEAFESAAAEVARAGGTVVARPPFGRSMSGVHYVIARGDELSDRALDDPYGYCRAMGDVLEAVIVLDPGGDSRAVAHTSGGSVARVGTEVDIVDETGADDAFAAGVLVGLGRGESLEQSIDHGLRWRASALLTPASMPPAWGAVAHDSL